MRLFLDANVLFSAAISPAGRARAFFILAQHTDITLMASPHALAEARRNIGNKRPEASAALEDLLSRLTVTLEATPDAVDRAASRGLPPQDAPILAAAVRAGVDLLVTGDRTHFGHLFGETLEGVAICTPADALARLLG